MKENELKVIDRMNTYGGSFVRALAKCFFVADSQNFRKLKETFADYWEEYSKEIQK